MTTLATASSLREAISPEALTRARRRLLTAHPDPTRANTPTWGNLTDEQLRVLAAHDWAPPRIGALDTNTLTTAAPITRALLAESVREILERRLGAERPTAPTTIRAQDTTPSAGDSSTITTTATTISREPPSARRPRPRDLCGPFDASRARRRRAHYRRTRPGLGHQPDHARPRRRGPARS